MKLYKYQSLDKLNEALEKFTEECVPVKKVKVLTVENADGYDEIVYFILVDTSYSYQEND